MGAERIYMILEFQVDDRINETTKKERIRRREERNGDGSHTLPHWRRAAQGIRERKCLKQESNESRSEKEDGSGACA